jgi:hypothetical protein
MTRISNLNSVSIKNYGPNYETLAVIKELKKLGLLKSVAKGKSRKGLAKATDAIKQESDMVGYTKTIGSPGAGFPLRLASSGMTQQQIDDINRINTASVATLKAEVEKQRLADIEAQQGQRFSDIERFGTILNPVLERFRGSTFPAQSSGNEPIDPFSERRPVSASITSEKEEAMIPDIQEQEFTETLNEGGPQFQPRFAEQQFSEEEELTPIGGGFPKPFEPQQKIRSPRASGKVKKRDEIAASYGLGIVPQYRDELSVIRQYYVDLADATAYDVNERIFYNKKNMLSEIHSILDELALTM